MRTTFSTMTNSRFWIFGVAGLAAAALVLAGAGLSRPDSSTADDAPALSPEAVQDRAGTLQTRDISLDQAMRVLDAARKKAREIGTKMDIAVVDAGGNLNAFARMDGAWLGSIDIAITKARTARYFDMPTGALGELSQPGGPLWQIEHSNDGLITFPGGVPIRTPDGTVIGAIGVSGSTVENDHTVATAGANVVAQAAGSMTDR